MKMLRLFLFWNVLIFVAQNKIQAQDYYNFDEKRPNKGKIAITPSAGISTKSLGGTSILYSGKLNYFFTENFSLGGQYVGFLETGSEDLGFFGQLGNPKNSIFLVAGGHYFPSDKRLGLHLTAGLGFLFEASVIGSYYDFGGDLKLSKRLTLQLSGIFVQSTAAASLGLQIKLL